MTDAQFVAKEWLIKLQEYEQKLKAEKRTLEMLEDKLYKGVSHYEGDTGRTDPLMRRAAHEDALIDFSEQTARVEKAQAVYIAELELRHEVINAIPENLQALAIDKYINGLKLEKLKEIYHYEQSQLYIYFGRILDNVAEVLNAKPTILRIDKAEKQAV